MEILQILSSLLSNGENDGVLGAIFKLLADNSFDLKKTLNNLNLKNIEPIIKEVMQATNKKSPTADYSPSVGLDPIALIADKEIVYALNRHFHQP